MALKMRKKCSEKIQFQRGKYREFIFTQNGIHTQNNGIKRERERVESKELKTFPDEMETQSVKKKKKRKERK